MKGIYEETLTGRTKAFGAGLLAALAVTLVAVALAPNPELEAASAQEPSPNGLASDDSQQRLAGEVFDRTELYFGSEKPGPDVTRQQFDRFVDEEVTPRFPDGLTLLTGYGQFRGADGDVVQERSFVLVLLYPPDDNKADGEIEELRDEYTDAFDQESVLRVDSRERVSF